MNDYFAVSAAGIEPATAAELARLGAADVRLASGGVHFAADPETLYRVLLWLRTASRVLRPLREFAAATAEMLYSQARRVSWEEWLAPDQTFAVHATLERHGPARTHHQRAPNWRQPAGISPDESPASHAGIDNSMFAALKIKDAICDRLRRERGARPNVDRKNPDLLVHAHFAGGRCTLSLDAVGVSLHERGYREQPTAAPLKETLAAAIVELTGWDGAGPLYDPFCGSGTLLIEAALKALNVAPGLSRPKFACRLWPDFDARLWEQAVAEARARRQTRLSHPIVGTDVNAHAIEAARRNATRAGVAEAMQFFVRPVAEMVPPTDVPGTLVTNPPYGERLGNERELAELYHRFGAALSDRFAGWTAWVLAGNLSLARHIDLPAKQKIKLFNGPIVCRLLMFAP
ncbi:MAG: THUMP domain-containing class I SAM-dependent RNA methyltransferase [Planctomycetaceae bacterium]